MITQRSDQESVPKSNAQQKLQTQLLEFRRMVIGKSTGEINARYVSSHTAPGDFGGQRTEATAIDGFGLCGSGLRVESRSSGLREGGPSRDFNFGPIFPYGLEVRNFGHVGRDLPRVSISTTFLGYFFRERSNRSTRSAI